jgi:hypothetical protein
MLHLSRMLCSTNTHTTERGPAGLLDHTCNSGWKAIKWCKAESFAKIQVQVNDATYGLKSILLVAVSG